MSGWLLGVIIGAFLALAIALIRDHRRQVERMIQWDERMSRVPDYIPGWMEAEKKP